MPKEIVLTKVYTEKIVTQNFSTLPPYVYVEGLFSNGRRLEHSFNNSLPEKLLKHLKVY